MIKDLVKTVFNMLKKIIKQLYAGLNFKTIVYLLLYIWTYAVSFIFRDKFVKGIGFKITQKGQIEKISFLLIRNLTNMFIIFPIVMAIARFMKTGGIKKSITDAIDIDSFSE
jgi:hypothetical protein